MSFVLTYDAIAKRIDHSLLGPALTTAEMEEGCRLARPLRGGERLHQTGRSGLGGRHSEGLGSGCGDDDRLSTRRAHDKREGI